MKHFHDIVDLILWSLIQLTSFNISQKTFIDFTADFQYNCNETKDNQDRNTAKAASVSWNVLLSPITITSLSKYEENINHSNFNLLIYLLHKIVHFKGDFYSRNPIMYVFI